MRKLVLTSVMLAALLLLAVGTATAKTDAVATTAERYLVVFNSPNSLPTNADRLVAEAGGTVLQRFDQIGTLVAASTSGTFEATLEANATVSGVDPDLAIKMVPDLQDLIGDVEPASADNNGGTYSPAGPDPQPMPDNLGREQWDKMRMNATLTGSYAVQPGRRDVVVAFLDTGVEVDHIDIAQNLDVARSRSFVATEPDIEDHHGHGSWIASAIAAPINVFGISGVAPNVTLVSLKVCSRLGRCPFSAIVAAYVYAGVNHFDVASASIGGYVNHSEFNAFFLALHRSIQFARENGVLPVAAMANNGFDLSDGAFMRDWKEVPGEIAGVVGVSATGYRNDKAFYSNYGFEGVDVAAPGGSTRDYSGVPGSGAAPGYRGLGRVLGAWSKETIGFFSPDQREQECHGGGEPTDTPSCSYYAWVQGTSMATPHVAGVAALIISQYGDFESRNPNHAHMSPTEVESILQITANNQPCPEPRTVIQGPGMYFPTATCEGADISGAGAGETNFFGKGIVDALNAVTFKR